MKKPQTLISLDWAIDALERIRDGKIKRQPKLVCNKAIAHLNMVKSFIRCTPMETK